MKKKHNQKFLFLMFILFLILINYPTRAQNAPKEMNVMTYNIRYKNNIDGINGWEYRKDNIAKLIKYHKGDLIGLQEANLKQINDLERKLTGYEWYGVPRVDSKKGGEFTPIFYRTNRYSLLDSGTFWFSETPYIKESKSWDAMYPRIASWCKFRDKTTGIEFFFFNTHFDHRGKVARQNSAEILCNQIDSIAVKHPVIAVGDFNAQESSITYQNIVKDGNIKDAFYISKAPHYGPVNTASGFAVSRKPIRARIDYIFVNNKVTVLQHTTITDQQRGRYYSDHLPVIAEIVMSGNIKK